MDKVDLSYTPAVSLVISVRTVVVYLDTHTTDSIHQYAQILCTPEFKCTLRLNPDTPRCSKLSSHKHYKMSSYDERVGSSLKRHWQSTVPGEEKVWSSLDSVNGMLGDKLAPVDIQV